MSANNILSFAQGGGANVLAQAAYLADAQRSSGNQPGTARSQLVNKALLQLSAMAAGLAQWLADNQGTDVSDSLTGSQISTMMWNAGAQSFGGVYRDRNTISAATTLGAADAQKVIICTGSSYTVTLPPANQARAGAVIQLRTSITGTVTAARNGTDTISAGNGNDSLTSMALGDGDSLTLVSDGASKWYAVGGTATSRYSNSHKGLLAASGYQKFPNGMILQWGTGTGSTTNTTNTFPIAFPTACVSIAIGNQDSNPITTYAAVSSFTTTNFLITINTGSARNVNWIAIGY